MADAWGLVRAFALRSPPELVVDVLLAALRQDEAPASAPNGGAALPLQAEQPPLSAPPRRKAGRPPGPRARRAGAAGRNGSKAAAPAGDTEAQPNGADREQKLAAALTTAREVACAFWARADALGGPPWRLIADRFPHVPEALAQDARRHHELPRGISVQMAREFIGAEAAQGVRDPASG